MLPTLYEIDTMIHHAAEEQFEIMHERNLKPNDPEMIEIEKEFQEE